MSQFLEILRAFRAAWVNPTLRPTALKVAVVVGSVLFTINHGAAVARGEMTRGSLDLWVTDVPRSLHSKHSWSICGFQQHRSKFL